MTDLSPVLDRADQNLPSSLDNLFELLRIKSISTDPDYKAECRKAAEWLTSYLNSLGFKASVRDTPGHPMVVAHHDAGSADAPHVLFYGHYDVQPVDPIELWENDPFEPAIKDSGNGRKILTGRGTADDKGQLMTFVEACRAYKEINGALPCRVTILFEGEEESGSPSLKPFLEANAAELKAEYAIACATSMWDRDTPAIAAALRIFSPGVCAGDESADRSTARAPRHVAGDADRAGRQCVRPFARERAPADADLAGAVAQGLQRAARRGLHMIFGGKTIAKFARELIQRKMRLGLGVEPEQLIGRDVVAQLVGIEPVADHNLGHLADAGRNGTAADFIHDEAR